QTVAEGAGFSVVREYVGHGIGRAMHEEPQVPNYGEPGRGLKLKVGHALAVEPMVNLGSADTQLNEDGWTVVTADGRLSAHFEHSIAVTDDGPEVLTVLDLRRAGQIGRPAARRPPGTERPELRYSIHLSPGSLLVDTRRQEKITCPSPRKTPS
ncbi:MAG TPA: M24 family metallopeptidase, partial [Acidimicrobiales bacterium]|nr:M24 family metallopeptidase [Acidimicrobiales bacterium]